MQQIQSYPTLLTLLALRHIIPTPKVHPFLCNFYAATAIAAIVGMRSLLHETAPEDRLGVEFLLSGVVNLVIAWILLIVSFTIPQ